MRFPSILRGKIIHGYGRGHKEIGFPTANLDFNDQDIEIREDDFGVYYGSVKLNDLIKYCVISVGINLTFKETKPTIEIHILNFNENIYNHFIEVNIYGIIRQMKKFNSIKELINQINSDIDEVKKLIS